MVNNPFRNKPSPNNQNKADDWGKIKFKPTKFRDSVKKPFEYSCNKPFNKKFDNEKRNSYGKYSEIARNVKPDDATPWSKFKDEMLFKQREEEQSTTQPNMESIEAKAVIKQKEINYRKSLNLERKLEPAKWEDFGIEKKGKKSSKFSTHKDGILKQTNEGRHLNEEQYNDNKLNLGSKTKFKKNVSNPKLKKYDAKGFISKEILDNFDSKKLNYKQNDKLRAVITKTALLATDDSLEKVVADLKKRKIKKEKRKV